jgi:hypothetical protein
MRKEVVPCSDRLSFTFTSAAFSNDPYSAATGITGFVVGFLPRGRTSGWNWGKDIYPDQNSVDFPQHYANFPLYPVDETLTPISTDGTSTVQLGDAYQMIAFGIDTVGRPRIRAISEGTDYDVYGAYVIQYTRFEQIVANVDTLRILGAGIKLNTTAAPINAGGFCYAGSARSEEILKVLTASYNNSQNLDQWLKTNLIDQTRNKAIRGIMVRMPYSSGTEYNTFRDVRIDTVSYAGVEADMDEKEQIEEKLNNLPPKPSSNKYTKSAYFKTPSSRTSKSIKAEDPGAVGAVNGAISVRTLDQDADPGAKDLIGVGDEIPLIYWSWQDTTEENTYDVDMLSMVHSEGIPKAICPFPTAESAKDPCLNFIQESVITDTSIFPVAHSGNSFKKLIEHLRRITGAVRTGATAVEKVLAVFG